MPAAPGVLGPFSALLSRRGARLFIILAAAFASLRLFAHHAPPHHVARLSSAFDYSFGLPRGASSPTSEAVFDASASYEDVSRPIKHRQDEYDGCEGWDAMRDAVHDPPNCLRARQYRQIQAFYADPKWPHDGDTYTAIRKLERCVLGYKVCPTRPLITSSWWYTFRGMRAGVSGEEVWMGEVEDDFIIISDFRVARMNQLTKDLSESIHQYWMREANAFECIQDPRCIRPEDYTPTTLPDIGYDLENITASGELGTLPMWRIMAMTYWGSRPANAGAPGLNMWYEWGIPEIPGGNEVWSFNPLGRRYTITPFPYPGHSWIPFSAERECLGTRNVPPAERNKTITILAKSSGYFAKPWASEELRDAWPELVAHLDGIDGHKFVTTASVQDNIPLPEGMLEVGGKSKVDYQILLSESKAMLGIGHPEISPSPYVALCKGTPVIMPYGGDTPNRGGWDMYNAGWAQHGPINELGEPWVYTYDEHNMTDLMRQLQRVLEAPPIDPYVPPEYSERAVKLQARRVLFYDYEGDYNEQVRANGGRPPAQPDYMVARCWERTHCFNVSYIDNIQG